MCTLDCQNFPRELKTCENIIPLQVGKLSQDPLHRITARKIFKYALNGVSKPADTWFPMANFRVNGDASKQTIIRHDAIVPSLLEYAKRERQIAFGRSPVVTVAD